MNTSYTVTIDTDVEIQITDQDLQEFDVIKTSTNKFHALNDNISYNSEILAQDFANKTYKVKVNNNTFSILINNNLDSLIKELGFEIGANKMVNEIKAPMPGLILEILVSKGQEVKENESLLILEAMKMENVIVSPREGIIKSITIGKGDAVVKNQLLLEFE